MAAALCLYALVLLSMPPPPKCPLPEGNETIRYTGREISRPVIATFRFTISGGWQPVCFGRLEAVNGFGWTHGTAAVLQEHSYHIFIRQRSAAGALLLIGGILPLLRQLFRHCRDRRHTVAGNKRDSA